MSRLEPIVLCRGNARTGNPVDNWNHGLAKAHAPLRVLVHQDEILADPHYLRDAARRLWRSPASSR